MNRIIKNKLIRPFSEKIKTIILPGFDKVPIYDVILFFVHGFRKGALVTRASSIAFNLLLALLPATFFIFSLIPFITIPNFQNALLELIENILPENVYLFLQSTIIESITIEHGVFLFTLLLASAIMATNGIHALIHAFVVSDHQFETRSWRGQRTISFYLLFIIVLMIALSAILLILGRIGIGKLIDMEILETKWRLYILMVLKWLVIIVLLFLTISFLYYLAPSRKARFRFMSAGSTLATLLFIITSLGFSA